MADNQLSLFFIYILSGIIIGSIFDVFRALRKSIKTSNTITYIEDAIFWIIVGCFLVWEIFTLSYGELRSYIFIGLLIGIVFYMLTISKFFIKINVKILNFLKSLILKVLNVFKNIFNFLIKILKPIFNLIKKPIYFICINVKKFLKITGMKINKSKNKKDLIADDKHKATKLDFNNLKKKNFNIKYCKKKDF